MNPSQLLNSWTSMFETQGFPAEQSFMSWDRGPPFHPFNQFNTFNPYQDKMYQDNSFPDKMYQDSPFPDKMYQDSPYRDVQQDQVMIFEGEGGGYGPKGEGGGYGPSDCFPSPPLLPSDFQSSDLCVRGADNPPPCGPGADNPPPGVRGPDNTPPEGVFPSPDSWYRNWKGLHTKKKTDHGEQYRPQL